MKKKLNKTQTISKSEIVIQLTIIISSFLFAYIGNNGVKQYISLLGLFIAFFSSLWLHKHFFPFIVMATLCYLLASLQEVWNDAYKYMEVTRFLWTAGNILLPIGFLHFLYRITFKYKIVDR